MFWLKIKTIPKINKEIAMLAKAMNIINRDLNMLKNASLKKKLKSLNFIDKHKLQVVGLLLVFLHLMIKHVLEYHLQYPCCELPLK